MRRGKKQLTLIISTTTVPLEADITYTGSTGHAHEPVVMRVHEFRLGVLAKPNENSTFFGVLHLRGPWDISGANKPDFKEFECLKGLSHKWPGEKKLITGLGEIRQFFGKNRKALFEQCLISLELGSAEYME
jgi:hypothetical protein